MNEPANQRTTSASVLFLAAIEQQAKKVDVQVDGELLDDSRPFRASVCFSHVPQFAVYPLMSRGGDSRWANRSFRFRPGHPRCLATTGHALSVVLMTVQRHLMAANKHPTGADGRRLSAAQKT